MPANSLDTVHLLERARTGDQDAINELLCLHRARLLKMVRTRLNPRVRSRVDESDVVQEAYLEAAKRLPEYLASPQTPFFLWLRQITGHKLIDVHRRHLRAQGRNAEIEVSLDDGQRLMASSMSLATQLLGQLTSPSEAYIKKETQVAVRDAMNAMDPMDREILALRQFEALTNKEAAVELGIEPAAASKRFVRALQRLQKILHGLGLVDSSL